MAHVVTSPCKGTKDTSCMKVCPVTCFYDAGDVLLINPDECIDCGLCVPECPVSAIFPVDEVPDTDKEWVDKNKVFFDGKSDDQKEALRMKP